MKNDELGWACGMYGDEHTGFWWADLRKRDDLEYLLVNGKIILNWIFKSGMKAWNGLIWLRTGTSHGLILAG
jgi:hypothetical protein